MKTNPDLNDIVPLLTDAIIVAYRGSIAHGTYVHSDDPNSIDDKDLMAVCIPSEDHYLGLSQWGNKGTKEIFKGEWDVVGYEVRKFLTLLSKGNPNVISMLYLNDEHVITSSPEWELIKANRDIFISKQIYHSFTGYAYSQLHKMTHLQFKGYMGDKRKRLVEKHGYDTKNAAHLIRLLRMCLEFFETGKFNVFREDAKELIDIKSGFWTLDKVKIEADKLFVVTKAAFERSKLPERPNEDLINQLCTKIVKMRLKTNTNKCPECKEETDFRRWEHTEVYCEDCGDHHAVRCPSCDESSDTVYHDELKCGKCD